MERVTTVVRGSVNFIRACGVNQRQFPSSATGFKLYRNQLEFLSENRDNISGPARFRTSSAV